jgi:hypothetical protein
MEKIIAAYYSSIPGLGLKHLGKSLNVRIAGSLAEVRTGKPIS